MDGPLLESLAGEVVALVRLVAAGPADAVVPTCPGWRLTELADHLARVHRWVTATLGAGGERVAGQQLPVRPDDVAPHAWLADGAQELVARLQQLPADAPAWTFSVTGDRTAGWWLRRQAVETALHRVDAALAIGAPVTPVRDVVALAGIEELLTDLAVDAVVEGVPLGGFGGTLHLHATDADCEWLVDCSTTPLTATVGHAKGDAALRGPVASLFLWSQNRADRAGLEAFGDTALLDAWTARVRL